MNEKKEKYQHPIYQALFWCSERKDFFRWNEFINYLKQANNEGK